MLTQVSPHVYVETANLGSNNSIIVAESGVVLIDAPHRPTDAVAWSQTAASFGEVEYLVHTDHHPDHVIGNAWLPGRVVAQRGTREHLESAPFDENYLHDLIQRIDPAALPLMAGYSTRLPEITFSDDLKIHMGNLTLELRHLPGHTANTLIAYCPEERVIFTGDNVCEAGLPSFQDCSLSAWFDVLDVIDAYDFDVLVSGHGETGGHDVVAKYRDKGRTVVQQVAEAMDNGMPRDIASQKIRFEDRIHVTTPKYVGYTNELIESFQVNSIERIYDALIDNPQLADK